MRKFGIFWLFLVIFMTHAQASFEVITAQNYTRLQSVKQVDFDDIGDFISGWFALSQDGEHIVVVDQEQRVIHISPDATQVLYQQADFVTGTLWGNTWVGLHTRDNTYDIVTVQNGEKSVFTTPIMGDLPDYPTEVFVSENEIMVEVQPLDSERKPYVFVLNRMTQAFETRPYAPAQDETSVVRIGRIPPPYTVTSRLNGDVLLWDWAQGTLLQVVNNRTGEPSVFGNLNTSATHLVWRDNANENLYLLNFATGDNWQIDTLNGAYAQWYFLSDNADVIIAVNLGFEPNVVAWDVASGKRTVLGEYRACNRPQPDMARLSADGTTLVIGCDTGIDVWRIVP
jgi:hypothetical protein